MSKSVYEIVTEEILKKLEAGTIPWRKPWTGGAAINWKSKKPYRGINTMLLEPGEYLTFKQIKEANGKLKKGSKSSIVVFWKMLEKEGSEKGTKEVIPLLRYYRVFNIKDCEGIEPRQQAETFYHDPIEEAEKVIENYIDKPRLQWKELQAYYMPSEDYVNMPPMEHFYNINEYYSTFFHELIHSTAHTSRLARKDVNQAAAFGSEDYSKEELVAEMGAAMLCGVTGIDNSTLDQSAAYIESWLRVLKDDKKLVVLAAQQAQKAADYIQGINHTREAN